MLKTCKLTAFALVIGSASVLAVESPDAAAPANPTASFADPSVYVGIMDCMESYKAGAQDLATCFDALDLESLPPDQAYTAQGLWLLLSLAIGSVNVLAADSPSEAASASPAGALADPSVYAGIMDCMESYKAGAQDLATCFDALELPPLDQAYTTRGFFVPPALLFLFAALYEGSGCPGWPDMVVPVNLIPEMLAGNYYGYMNWRSYSYPIGMFCHEF